MTSASGSQANSTHGCCSSKRFSSVPFTGCASSLFPERSKNTSMDSGIRSRTKERLPSDSSRLIFIVRARSTPSTAARVQGVSMLRAARSASSSAQAMALLRKSRSPKVSRGFADRRLLLKRPRERFARCDTLSFALSAAKERPKSVPLAAAIPSKSARLFACRAAPEQGASRPSSLRGRELRNLPMRALRSAAALSRRAERSRALRPASAVRSFAFSPKPSASFS